jgi:hypothetical protein
MGIHGSVDLLTTREAAGWAYAPDRRDGVTVQAMLNHEIVGEAVANLHRPDLAAAGFGDGNCGYTVAFYREIDPLYLPFVVIRPDGGDVELPRTSQGGFVDFFSALYRSYPQTGRSRTVLGGLWTDRTDAASLLRGKTTVGLVPAESSAAIDRLIQHGLAHVEGVDIEEFGWLPTLTADLVGTVVGSALVMNVLQPVLEDQPLAISADIIKGRDTELRQPSTEHDLPSPAECLAVVVPLSDKAVVLDAVRDSHTLPEFTRSGVSRWTKAEAAAEIAVSQHGLLERHEVPAGSAAIVGPGLIHVVRGGLGGSALKVLVVPSRGVPVALARQGARSECIGRNGIRVWL